MELEQETNQQGQPWLYVRDPELDEGKQSQQIRLFVREKVDVIVINWSKAIIQVSFPSKGQESWD